MKSKNLYILASAMLLSSCSNEITEVNAGFDNTGRQPITILAYAQGATTQANAPQTRSVGTQITDLTGGFYLYAETTKDGETTVLANNLKVTYNNGQFELASPIYWPADANQEVRFYAITREEHNTWVPGSTTPDWADEYDVPDGVMPEHISYTFDNTADDCLIGYTAAKLSLGTSVSLELKHMTTLLKLCFKGAYSQYSYEITDLSLVAGTGGMYDPVAPKYYLYNAGTADFEILKDASGAGSTIPANTTSYWYLQNEDGSDWTILLYPDYVTVEVTYNVKEGNEILESYTKSANMVTIQPGNQTTLQLTLPYDDAPMTFEVSADGWGTAVEGEETPEQEPEEVGPGSMS